MLSAIHDIVTKSEQGMLPDPLVITDVTINDKWLRDNSVAGFREIETLFSPGKIVGAEKGARPPARQYCEV